MKKLLLIVLCLLSLNTFSQTYSTIDELPGLWINNSTWTTTRPDTIVLSNATLHINGTVTAPSIQLGNMDNIIIHPSDTLIIDGDFNVGNRATLFISAGAVLLITGNSNINNKLSIVSTGTILMNGNVTLGTNATINSFGPMYVLGTINMTGVAGYHPVSTAEQLMAADPDLNLMLTELIIKTPLPIELGEFTAVPDGTFVFVKWNTLSEMNNDYFELDKSTDGINFNSIYIIAGAGTSSVEHTYSYFDELSEGISYYQLKQTDFDNTTSYSDIVSVKGTYFHAKYTQTNNYIHIQCSVNDNYIISIVSQDGIVCFKKPIYNICDTYVNIESLTPGIYFLVCEMNNKIESYKFIK